MTHLDSDQLRQLAHQVARSLPDEWTAAEDKNAIQGPDGMELLISNGRYSPGLIIGCLPNVTCRSIEDEEHSQRCQIGVTLSRPPHQIAKEILRRLLPHYVPIYRERQELDQAFERARVRRQELADRATELFPHPHQVRAHSATEVDVRLYLNAHQLEAVATALSSH